VLRELRLVRQTSHQVSAIGLARAELQRLAPDRQTQCAFERAGAAAVVCYRPHVLHALLNQSKREIDTGAFAGQHDDRRLGYGLRQCRPGQQAACIDEREREDDRRIALGRERASRLDQAPAVLEFEGAEGIVGGERRHSGAIPLDDQHAHRGFAHCRLPAVACLCNGPHRRPGDSGAGDGNRTHAICRVRIAPRGAILP
jgi:hypothetical protein